MKKIITLLGLFVAILPLMAQTDDGELVISNNSIGTVKKNVFFVGPKIGATFTSGEFSMIAPEAFTTQ